MSEFSFPQQVENFLEEVNSESEPRFRPVRMGELMAKPFPPEPWLVEGRMPEHGITVLSGAPNQGKTWVLLSLATSFLTGLPLFGRLPVKQCKAVLLLDEENGERLIQNRLQLLGYQDADLAFYMTFFSDFRADRPDMVDELLALCKELDVDVILVDSLVRVTSGNENDAGDMAKVSRGFRRLCANGISVVVTHHHRKSQGAEPSSNMGLELRGSSEITAGIDSHIALTKEGNTLTFRQGKLRQAPVQPDFTINLKSSGGLVTLEFAGEEMGEEFAIKSEIVRLLEEQGELNHRDLLKAAQELFPQKSSTALGRQLELLLEEGSIEQRRGLNNAKLYSVRLSGLTDPSASETEEPVGGSNGIE